MTDRIKERLKNQGVAFTRYAAKVHLEKAGVTLSHEWSRERTAEPAGEVRSQQSQQSKRRTAGG